MKDLLREGLCGPGILRHTLQFPDGLRSGYILERAGRPGLCGVDTRELTRIIREHGVMNAAICDEIPADLTPIKTYAITGVVEAVSCKEPDRYQAEGEERFRVSPSTTAPSATLSGSSRSGAVP